MEKRRSTFSFTSYIDTLSYFNIDYLRDLTELSAFFNP